MPVTFSRDGRGKVTGLTAHIPGAEFSYAKISDQPPKASEPPNRVSPSSWTQNFSMSVSANTNLRRTT